MHALYCVLALVLITLTRRELSRAGIELSTTEMLTDLTRIKGVALIYPRGAPVRGRDHVTLSRTSKQQKRLIEALDLAPLLPEKR